MESRLQKNIKSLKTIGVRSVKLIRVEARRRSWQSRSCVDAVRLT
jgi:hypothetical protein